MKTSIAFVLGIVLTLGTVLGSRALAQQATSVPCNVVGTTMTCDLSGVIGGTWTPTLTSATATPSPTPRPTLATTTPTSIATAGVTGTPTSVATITATLSPTPIPTATNTPSASTNSPALMLADMTLPHQGCLDANYVGGYSWQYGPELANAAPPSGYKAETGWFAVTLDATATGCHGQPAAPVNTRVEINNFAAFAFTGGRWALLQDQDASGIGSGLWTPNFHTFVRNPSLRVEPDGGTSWAPVSGTLWHGWPGWRATVPAGTQGICAQFQARLIQGDANGPDNRATALVLAEAGFDYWQGVTSGSNVLGMNGRYKRLGVDYAWFNGCNAPLAAIASAPLR